MWDTELSGANVDVAIFRLNASGSFYATTGPAPASLFDLNMGGRCQ